MHSYHIILSRYFINRPYGVEALEMLPLKMLSLERLKMLSLEMLPLKVLSLEV